MNSFFSAQISVYIALDVGTPIHPFHSSESAIITAGSDSLIRVFKTAKDERDAAATTIDKHSEAIQSIAVHVMSLNTFVLYTVVPG